MSRVFLAEDRALERQVVVKVLKPDMAEGVSVDRFRREIQLAAQLQHPHIVPAARVRRSRGDSVLHDAVHRRRIAARAACTRR